MAMVLTPFCGIIDMFNFLYCAILHLINYRISKQLLDKSAPILSLPLVSIPSHLNFDSQRRICPLPLKGSTATSNTGSKPFLIGHGRRTEQS